jgi:hypothetical protein
LPAKSETNKNPTDSTILLLRTIPKVTLLSWFFKRGPRQVYRPSIAIQTEYMSVVGGMWDGSMVILLFYYTD